MHAEVILFFPVNDNLINQSMHYTRYEQCMKRVSQWRQTDSVPLALCASGMMPRST